MRSPMAPGGSLGAALLAWGRCLVLGLGLALGARLREQQSLGAVMVLVSRPWDKPRGNRRCFFNTFMASQPRRSLVSLEPLPSLLAVSRQMVQDGENDNTAHLAAGLSLH